MEILLNDRPFTLPECDRITAQQLVEIQFPENQRGIALALGSEILPREEWGYQVIRPNDKVFIFKATQGG
ncbi:sulfur carrier protein ThiS [Negadavirga shengliensis]|uniref:MoaD/ThiS family protein n=1 Tax=Negadavirga shengliensis TaxID=1389218 RepID=A0ABV9T790_9BACT